jgi:hypothetical protein
MELVLFPTAAIVNGYVALRLGCGAAGAAPVVTETASESGTMVTVWELVSPNWDVDVSVIEPFPAEAR